MKKWIAVFGFLLVLTSAISANAIAANEYTEETFYKLTIGGNGIQKDVDYSFENNALIILSEKEMTISGTSTINENTRIKVTSEHGANLIFSDLTVELFLGEPGNPTMQGNPSAAFGVDDNVEYVNITLKGTNKLQSGPGHAGLENNSVPLVIKGEEDVELTALGYDGGAGIGGGKDKDGENITIEGGTIIATGIAGAGIGGGENKSGRHIKISGGTVTATGTYKEAVSSYDRYPAGGAGIGGGLYGDGTDIEISGGEVKAKVENSGRGFHFGGAGIGGGCGGIAENITISGGKVEAQACDGGSGAAIGGGGGYRSGLCGHDHPDKTSGGTCTNITITGSADVEARGTYYGAGIGGGSGGSCNTITIELDDNGKIYAKGGGGAGIGGGEGGKGENIYISGKGEITAEIRTSTGGAGIGGGEGGEGKNINISGKVKVTAYVATGAGIGGGYGADGSKITITLDDNESGFVNATCYSSTGGSAGIGGGYGANGYDITINSGKVTATSSSGAGIGGGAAKYTPPFNYEDGTGIGSNITIKGGLITATSGSGAGIGGGSHSDGSDIKIYDCTSIEATSNGGAGIGGGSCGNGTDITISGGKYIEANGGQGSAGIGGGMNQQGTSGGDGTNIIISGGEIHATGGSGPGGAGIGSGYSGNAEGIKISGDAIIFAEGVSGGAGIGGGMNGNVKDIEISGNAEVEAKGQGGAGIGSGSSGNAERIEISGNAKVETTGQGGAGIGSGSGGNVKDIEISGNAEVEAKGQGGAGIGSGSSGNAERIEISGNAKVETTGQGGAGIGGGSGGSCTDITISSGNVTATGVGSDTINSSGISATDVTIDGKDTVVTAEGGGSGAGITGGNIIINNGDITAKGGANGGTGINGTTVSMGESETSYPWISTNGINGLTTGGIRSDLAIVFNIDKTEGTIYGGVVELTEPYELKAPCTKLTVKTGAEFITDNKLTLNDGVILYLEAGAKLDKYNKMTIIKGEIQHEDKSIYVPDTTSRAVKMVCDICGKEEPHNWKTEWENDDTHHWHECTPGKDCAVVPNDIEVCSITENSQKDGYGEHEYDFDAPAYGADGRLHYFCKDCNYELIVDIPVIQLIKVDGENAPLAGAEFGLYNDEACTKLNTSTNPNANSTATTATDANHKAVVSFAAELDKTYYIKEIKAPEDYNISKDVFKAVVDKDGKVTYGVVGSETTSEDIPICKNYAIEDIVSDPIKIIKVDGETGDSLAGAQFSVYSDAECKNLITSTNPTATTAIDTDKASDTYNKAVVSFDTELDTTYYIKETKAPDGYTASDKVFKAVVGKDGKVAYSVVGSTATSEEIPVCENYAVEVVVSDPIKIIKVDGETNSPLAGAQFSVFSDAACQNPITSMTGTTTIDADKASNTYNKAVVSFSTEPGTTYYIKETKAPDGYTASDKVFKAVVGADGKVAYSVVGSTATSEEIPVCENYAVAVTPDPIEIIPAPAKIIKVDGETGAPLAGAQFGIYSDAACKNLITSTNPTATTAIDADKASDTYNKAVVSFDTELNETYYIREITPPKGYTASDKVFKAVVGADGKVTYGIVGSTDTSEEIPVCENYAVKVIVSDPAKIIKVDGETGAPLAGAQFGIYRDAERTQLIKTVTAEIDTDNTSATYNKAVVSFDTEPNSTYYIKETFAPDGYRVSDEVFKAVVDADGKVTYGTVGSETTSADIPVCENYAVGVTPDPIVIVSAPAKIIKVDSETGSPLAGAQFGIYSDAECTKLITTGITVIDTDNASATYNQAVVSFSTEPNKTYFIKETNAPDGYRVSHEVFKAVVDADGKVTYGVAGSATTSETMPICKNEKTDEDDDISDLEPDPEDTPPAKAVSPKTGDTSGSGIVGMAILSGITCAVSLVVGVQKRKKKQRYS